MTGSSIRCVPCRSCITDYAEERASELEVLESIFPDELTGTFCPLPASLTAPVISPSCVSIRVEPEVQSASEPCSSPLPLDELTAPGRHAAARGHVL